MRFHRVLPACLTLMCVFARGQARAEDGVSPPPLVEAETPVSPPPLVEAEPQLGFRGERAAEEPSAASWNRGARFSLMVLAGAGGTAGGTALGAAAGAGLGALAGGCQLAILGGRNELGCLVGGVVGATAGLILGTALLVDLVGIAGGGGPGFGRSLGGALLGGVAAVVALAALSWQVTAESGVILAMLPALFASGLYEIGADSGPEKREPLARLTPVVSLRGGGGSVGIAAFF